MAALRELYRKVLVVAHREDTTELEATLETEGFAVRRIQGPYPEGAERWSPSVRTLFNHRNAWRVVSESGEAAIVVEADFVPVRGFGAVSLSRGLPSGEPDFTYLYACGPQLWGLRGGRLRGHAGAMVAYCVSPALASSLIEFADSKVLAGDPASYSRWDTELGYWLKARGIESYLPYRHHGEHGGLPNPEHGRAGLRPHHRADLLSGRLAFLPAYARGSRLRFVWFRIGARGWGVIRLLAGRYLSWQSFRRSNEKGRLLRIAVGRFLFREAPASVAGSGR
jgi:hypothetical protein